MKINILTPCETRSLLESVSDRFTPNPFHLYPQISRALKSTLFKNEMTSFIKDDSFIWNSQNSDHHVLLIYTPSTFDSEVFGYPVGRLSLVASDSFVDIEKSNKIVIHWIRNALQGQLGSMVLYAHENGHSLGFFSCRPRSEICSNLKIRIWGRGLATVASNSKGAYIALVNAALKRSPDYCDLMEFETQASNLMVLRIGVKYNFKLISFFLTLHWRA